MHARYLDQQLPITDMLSDLMDKVAKDKIKPKPAKTFPIEKIREAYRALEYTRIGRVVIKVQ